jgi:uncharacterized protein YcfJ
MKVYTRTAAGLMAVVALTGCVSRPSGPTVAVMPGPGKSFEAFQTDDLVCKGYANQQVAGSEDTANNTQLGTAVLGTVLGAGLGAAIGGGRGAAIGAGAGALGGTAIGGSNAEHSQYSLQQRYNIAYEQCMASKGNRLPTPGYVTYYSPYAPPPPAAVVVPPAPSPAPLPPPGPTVTPAPSPTVTPQ